MTFKELVLFGILIVGAGISIGALFDKLIFAFLLKLMKLKVELATTFQMKVIITVLLVFGLIFLGFMFLNALQITRMNALQLSPEKASGEKRGHFLPLQTILGSISLGIGYYLALTVTDPLTVLTTFF